MDIDQILNEIFSWCKSVGEQEPHLNAMAHNILPPDFRPTWTFILKDPGREDIDVVYGSALTFEDALEGARQELASELNEGDDGLYDPRDFELVAAVAGIKQVIR